MALRIGAARLRQVPGPTGFWTPPRTPSRKAAATHTAATMAAVQTLLNDPAVPGGSVIEYTGPGLATDTVLAHSAAAEARTSNVLVRPPLGSRVTIAGMEVAAANVTVANFTCTSFAEVRSRTSNANEARNSALWRIVSASQFALAGGIDTWLVECVNPEVRYGTGDTCQVKGGTTIPVTRPTLLGCYLAGKLRDVDAVGAFSLSAVGAATGPVQVAAGTATNGVSITAFSVMLTAPATVEQTWRFQLGGVTAVEIVLPAGERFRKAEQLAFSGTGQAVTVELVSGTLAPGVTATLRGGPATAHSDTVQIETGSIIEPRLLYNVLGPSSNAAIERGGSYDLRLLGNYVGRQAAYPNVGPTTTVRMQANDYFLDNIIPSQSIDGVAKVWRNNVYNTVNGTSPEGANTVDPALMLRQPALPDLTAIWPECPWSPT